MAVAKLEWEARDTSAFDDLETIAHYGCVQAAVGGAELTEAELMAALHLAGVIEPMVERIGRGNKCPLCRKVVQPGHHSACGPGGVIQACRSTCHHAVVNVLNSFLRGTLGCSAMTEVKIRCVELDNYCTDPEDGTRGDVWVVTHDGKSFIVEVKTINLRALTNRSRRDIKAYVKKRRLDAKAQYPDSVRARVRPFVISTSGQLLDKQTKKLAAELQELRDKQGAAAHVRDPRASLKAQLGKALCAADAHRYSSWAAECASVRNTQADMAASAASLLQQALPQMISSCDSATGNPFAANGTRA